MSTSRFGRGLRSALLLAWAVIGATAVSAAPTTVQLPENVKGFAISAKGAVGIIDGEDGVSLYNNLANGVALPDATAKVGGKSLAITYKPLGKDAYFLVLSAGNRTLYMLDAATLKTVKTIQLTADV